MSRLLHVGGPDPCPETPELDQGAARVPASWESVSREVRQEGALGTEEPDARGERSATPGVPLPVVTVHADVPGNAWVATFHENPAIFRLFATDTIPTPFTLHASGREVREEVQRLHPHARVRLIDRDGTLFDPDPPEGDSGGAQLQVLRQSGLTLYRIRDTALTLSLHHEDAPPSVCIGIGFGDDATYGGCDAHDAEALAGAIERGEDLTLHATASGQVRARVTWAGGGLTVAAYHYTATQTLPDPRARAAVGEALRRIADRGRGTDEA